MEKGQMERKNLQDIIHWRPHPTVIRMWRFLRPVLVVGISFAVAYFAFSFAFNYALNKYISPVDINDPTPITVVVENSDSASRIAAKLYNACGEDEPGLIANTAIFKVYVDFIGKANKLKSGTYILSRNMDIPQIVDVICAGNPPKETTNFKVLEGYTVSGVLKSLDDAKLPIDQVEFLALCNDKQAYAKYDFINQLEINVGAEKRDYLLEGYLFPDTYTVFVDAQPDDIITKMLIRFNAIFTEEYVARADELGMTIDEVITLASIIQREAALADDFPKVSAVFHNRLNKKQKLESCATLQYVLKGNKLQYNEEERATESPYNTYLHEGLPIGPIGNPGKQAIEAALYPEEEYLEKGYLYFCNMDLPDNRALIFARTYEQHVKNIKKYEKYW